MAAAYNQVVTRGVRVVWCVSVGSAMTTAEYNRGASACGKLSGHRELNRESLK